MSSAISAVTRCRSAKSACSASVYDQILDQQRPVRSVDVGRHDIVEKVQVPFGPWSDKQEQLFERDASV